MPPSSSHPSAEAPTATAPTDTTVDELRTLIARITANDPHARCRVGEGPLAPLAEALNTLATYLAAGRTKASEAFGIEALVAQAPNMMAAFDLQAQFRFMNFTIPGWVIGPSMGMSVYNLIAPEEHPRVRGIIQKVIETGEPQGYEIRSIVQPGPEWFAVRVGPIKAGHEIVGFTMIFTDISDLKQTQTRLEQANRELDSTLKQLRDTQKQLVTQEKLASLGSLTAGIAHELKNPLNFVNNFAQLSSGLVDELTASLESQRPRMEPAVSAEVDEVLGGLRLNMSKIWEHGNRANQIIGSMLLHSRESSGKKEPADLNAVIKECLLLGYHGSRANIPSFELSIQTDYDPHVGKVEMVVSEIVRVLVNLVDNACYSMQQKKRELGAAFSPRLEVRTRDLGNRVEVRIRDNGTGVPSTLVDKVFDPFLTTKPTGEGTGLGLSISHDIITGYHQGDLRLESVEGEFAEFTLELPKQAPRG
jgi:PAS domain S-box-containing protein